MVDRDQLIKLIGESHSLSDKEKQHFIEIVPEIEDKHVAYFCNVFGAEQKIWEQMPMVEEALEKGLQDMFNQLPKAFQTFSSDMVKETESNLQKKQLADVESKIDNL